MASSLEHYPLSPQTTILENVFPSLEAYSVYKHHFIYSVLYCVWKLDVLTAHLHSPFMISPTFGPLSLSIAQNENKETIISYNLRSNRPTNSFYLEMQTGHPQEYVTEKDEVTTEKEIVDNTMDPLPATIDVVNAFAGSVAKGEELTIDKDIGVEETNVLEIKGVSA